MPIAWSPKLSTHNQIIDQDHKYLICLFNSIELALKDDESLEHLPLFVNQLLEYTREHFAREERIQLKINYPKYAEHKGQHQQIIDRLQRIDNEIVELFRANDTLLENASGAQPEPTPDPNPDPEQAQTGRAAVSLHDEADERAEKIAHLRQRLRTNLLTLAREWILDHLVHTDLELAKYLRNRPPEFAG